MCLWLCLCLCLWRHLASAADRYGKEPGEYLLLRMELTHVVNNLENYMMHQVHSDPPSRLQLALDAAHDLDEIAALHGKFLERLRDRFQRVVGPPSCPRLTSLTRTASQMPLLPCACRAQPRRESGRFGTCRSPALLAREIPVTHSWHGAGRAHDRCLLHKKAVVVADTGASLFFVRVSLVVVADTGVSLRCRPRMSPRVWCRVVKGGPMLVPFNVKRLECVTLKPCCQKAFRRRGIQPQGSHEARCVLGHQRVWRVICVLSEQGHLCDVTIYMCPNHVPVRKILNLALEFRRWYPQYLAAQHRLKTGDDGLQVPATLLSCFGRSCACAEAVTRFCTLSD